MLKLYYDLICDIIASCIYSTFDIYYVENLLNIFYTNGEGSNFILIKIFSLIPMISPAHRTKKPAS